MTYHDIRARPAVGIVEHYFGHFPMKRLLLYITIILIATGCQDEQKQFCIQASTKLCDRCQSCGGDFHACGLNRIHSREECVQVLQTVCAAYDSLYSKEVSRTCLHELDQISCEKLKAEGKPETCTRLF